MERLRWRSFWIGGIPDVQEVINYCAKHKIYPQILIRKKENPAKAGFPFKFF